MDIAESATIVESIGSRADGYRKCSEVNVVARRQTRSTEPDTLLYIVQYEGNAGFAVVSAPTCVEPVLAIIDEGSYDSAETRANEPFNLAMSEMEDYVRAASIIGPYIPIPVPIDSYTDTIVTGNQIGPKLKTKWGKEWPQGAHCPNKICGCVALAGVEIMGALQLPRTIAFTYQGKTTEQILDWNNLTKHIHGDLGKSPSEEEINNHLANCAGNIEAHQLLADICREVGYRIDAWYKANSTAANTWDLAYLLKRLTQLNFNSGENPKDLALELKKNHNIALVKGHGLAGGHAWVADGCLEIATTINHYELVIHPKLGTSESKYEYRLVNSEVSTIPYLHYNWGWHGNCNGWFSTNIFSPDQATAYDEPNAPLGYDFTEDYRFWAF